MIVLSEESVAEHPIWLSLSYTLLYCKRVRYTLVSTHHHEYLPHNEVITFAMMHKKARDSFYHACANMKEYCSVSLGSQEIQTIQNTVTKAATSFWPIVFPLALAQFVCSYAATTMNVSISSIATDLGTDVHAIQITITFFTLTMAALMIPGSKLSDIWGR